jgi:chemotaxis-related protein WspD
MSAAKKAARFKVNDCWKRNGVWGDKQCPDLVRWRHCRNCEVYSRTGRQLLDRKLPAGYVQAWTRQLAKPEETPLPGRISTLVFRIGPEWFAMATRLFAEVLETREVHTIPHRSNRILRGLINVRGEMQLCVSIGKILGVDKDFSAEETDGSKIITRMLLFSMHGEQIAFHVNETCGIHPYHPSELQPLPATLSSEASACSRGLLQWQGHHVAILDEDILFEKMMESI